MNNIDRSIGYTAREAMLLGATNSQALEHVLKHHQDANTTIECMKWYRNKLGHNGAEVMRSRDITRVRRADRKR